MKTTLYIVALTFAFISCSQKQQANTAICTSCKNDSIAVIQTDKDFCNYCSKHGLSAAFIKYSDSSAIEMGQGKLPVMGNGAVKAAYVKRNDTTTNLYWTPIKACACGDLAYTFGWWKFPDKTKAGKDTTYYGYYVTIWGKQKDGSWKYVLDGGNDTPMPPAK